MLKKIFLVTFIFLSLLAGCGYTGKSILPPTIKKLLYLHLQTKL